MRAKRLDEGLGLRIAIDFHDIDGDGHSDRNVTDDKFTVTKRFDTLRQQIRCVQSLMRPTHNGSAERSGGVIRTKPLAKTPTQLSMRLYNRIINTNLQMDDRLTGPQSWHRKVRYLCKMQSEMPHPTKIFDGNLNKSKDDASHRRQELINMIEYRRRLMDT